jgi:hypothetical protein
VVAVASPPTGAVVEDALVAVSVLDPPQPASRATASAAAAPHPAAADRLRPMPVPFRRGGD